MANLQTFFLKDLFFLSELFLDTFSLSAQKQHILVLRNTPNCSSVHSGMTGILLAELALHNRCEVWLRLIGVNLINNLFSCYKLEFTKSDQQNIFIFLFSCKVSWKSLKEIPTGKCIYQKRKISKIDLCQGSVTFDTSIKTLSFLIKFQFGTNPFFLFKTNKSRLVHFPPSTRNPI